MSSHTVQGVLIPVTDMQRSAGFYEKLLGIAPAIRSAGWIQFDLAPGVNVALHPARASAPTTERLAQGRAVLLLRVEDIDAEYERLRQLGMAAAPPHVSPDIPTPVLEVIDPDGFVIQAGGPRRA